MWHIPLFKIFPVLADFAKKLLGIMNEVQQAKSQKEVVEAVRRQTKAAEELKVATKEAVRVSQEQTEQLKALRAETVRVAKELEQLEVEMRAGRGNRRRLARAIEADAAAKRLLAEAIRDDAHSRRTVAEAIENHAAALEKIAVSVEQVHEVDTSRVRTIVREVQSSVPLLLPPAGETTH